MTIGQFIQAGPTPSGETRDGYGEYVTVDKLEALERSRIRTHITNVRPELLVEGIRAMRAKIEADAALEKVRKDLQLAVGGDGLRPALAMIAEEAAKQSAAEAKTKAQAQSKK